MFFDGVMQMLVVVDMVYHDFSKAFDKVNHDILLLKLKALGITGNHGVWFYNFLIHHSHFVRLPGGISTDTPVLWCTSGHSAGTPTFPNSDC